MTIHSSLFPQVRVERDGPYVSKVMWDDGQTVVDLTGMRVTKVEATVSPGEMPRVRIDFAACLTEKQEGDGCGC